MTTSYSLKVPFQLHSSLGQCAGSTWNSRFVALSGKVWNRIALNEGTPTQFWCWSIPFLIWCSLRPCPREVSAHSPWWPKRAGFFICCIAGRAGGQVSWAVGQMIQLPRSGFSFPAHSFYQNLDIVSFKKMISHLNISSMQNCILHTSEVWTIHEHNILYIFLYISSTNTTFSAHLFTLQEAVFIFCSFLDTARTFLCLLGSAIQSGESIQIYSTQNYNCVAKPVGAITTCSLLVDRSNQIW